jgi:hypothetical protein
VTGLATLDQGDVEALAGKPVGDRGAEDARAGDYRGCVPGRK